MNERLSTMQLCETHYWLLRCQVLVHYHVSCAVMTAMQIHSRHGLTHGSLANLFFAHYELRLRADRWIVCSICRLRKSMLCADRWIVRSICRLRKSMLCAQHTHVTQYNTIHCNVHVHVRGYLHIGLHKNVITHA